MMLTLYVLLVFIIIAALVAVEINNLLSSVIAVGTIGLCLCIIFLLLGAPDLAITQLVVEILALIILIRATLAKTVPDTYRGREVLAYFGTIIFIIVFLGFSFYAVKALPEFGSPVMRVADKYISQGLDKTGAPNLVTGITLGFRAYDTLGAAAVLFAAVIGTLVILRAKGRKSIDERDEIDS